MPKIYIRRIELLLHTHTLHTQTTTNHVDADEWRRFEKSQACEVHRGVCVHPPFIQATDPLHRWGQAWGRLHRDHFLRPCRQALWCYRRRLPGCWWSLMNVSSGCAPSPPLCFELPHTQPQTAAVAAFIMACRLLGSVCLNGLFEGNCCAPKSLHNGALEK